MSTTSGPNDFNAAIIKESGKTAAWSAASSRVRR